MDIYMFRKPNRRIFDLALEKAGLNPEEVWYIGDDYECDVKGDLNAWRLIYLVQRIRVF